MARVLDALRRQGAMTQIEIAGATGLSPATVSNLVRELVTAQAVNVSPSIRNGRRAALVALAAHEGLLGSVIFTERELRVAVASAPAEILAQQRMPLPEGHQADETMNRAARLMKDLADRSGHDTSEIIAIGAGLAAPVDSVTGQVGSEEILRGWGGVGVAVALEGRLGAPTFVDNSTNLAALGELRHGALQGVRTATFLNVGHGVGAGLIIEGQVFRGSAGTAGEIGHITLDEDGVVCRCGNRGCLDTLVGSRALLAAVRDTHGDMRLRDLLALALSGDPGCRRVLEDAGRHVGVASATLVNLFNPDVIVLGGEMAIAADIVVGPMREALDRSAIPSAAATVELRVAALGDRAATLGALAAAAALQGEQLSAAG